MAQQQGPFPQQQPYSQGVYQGSYQGPPLPPYSQSSMPAFQQWQPSQEQYGNWQPIQPPLSPEAVLMQGLLDRYRLHDAWQAETRRQRILCIGLTLVCIFIYALVAIIILLEHRPTLIEELNGIFGTAISAGILGWAILGVLQMLLIKQEPKLPPSTIILKSK